MDPPETGRGELVIRGARIGNLWASLLDKCTDRYKSKSKSSQRHCLQSYRADYINVITMGRTY